ncbi:MAG: exosome complex protein Rrp42 [Candidatus Aenigmatarchaeota archaeon]
MKTYAYDLLVNDKRIDGRKMEDYRKIELKRGIIKNAEGSAVCKMGNTKIIVGVKMGIGTPFADTPDDGNLVVNAEFTPLASPDFEAGPPGEDATELARVVDRGIRESDSVDFKKLCITSGEKVWMMNVDIHIINHDGNLVDCAFLAAMAALMDTKVPKLEDDKILRGEYESALSVSHTPIEVTVCKVEGKFLIDPTKEEEGAIETKLTVAVREDEKICALQKQGPKDLSVDDIRRMVETSIAKSAELRKLLKR